MVSQLLSSFGDKMIINSYRYAGGFTDPTDIPGLTLWLDATDASTLWTTSAKATQVSSNNDQVGYWGDKSGNANDMHQTSDVHRPTYKTSVQNGLSAIYNNGANLHRLFTTALSPGIFATDFTAFTVTRNELDADIGVIISSADLGDSGAADRITIYDDTGSVNDAIAIVPPSVILTSASDLSPVWGIRTVTLSDQSSAEAWLDGASQDTGTATKTLVEDNVQLFSQSTSSGVLQGWIGEIVIYDSVLSMANRQIVELYLKTRWDTP